MIRKLLVGVFAGLSLIMVGCTKSSEPPRRAETAKKGLMPAQEPGFDAAYLVDQKDVKLAAAREVSYEPLDTFREQAAAREQTREASRAAKPAEASAEASSPDTGEGVESAVAETKAPAKVERKTPATQSRGLFKRMKAAALGGVLPGMGRGAAPKPTGARPGSGMPPGAKPEAKPPAAKPPTGKPAAEKGGAQGGRPALKGKTDNKEEKAVAEEEEDDSEESDETADEAEDQEAEDAEGENSDEAGEEAQEGGESDE
jgi:hypothetical protein